MRRMYSVQELSEIVSAVVGEKIEDGSFDELMADAVDDYLTEHPVDITALEGLDISVGSLDADGLVTGAEIIEKMSGYSLTKSTTDEYSEFEYVYAGVVKTGNKITFVLALNYTKLDSKNNVILGKFNIPSEVGTKLYPVTIGGYAYLENTYKKFIYHSNFSATSDMNVYINKNSDTQITILFGSNSSLTANSKAYVRLEFTFLLSENLAS